MRKLINLIVISLMLIMANIAFAAPLPPNNGMVKGLTLASSMAQVKQVMGEPYRVSSWATLNDTMYEYPGVNFVFLTKYGSLNYPLIKIIVDGPQAALANGLTVGASLDTVTSKLGNDYKFIPANDELEYKVVIDPVTYQVGLITIQMNGSQVKRIIVEKEKG